MSCVLLGTPPGGNLHVPLDAGDEAKARIFKLYWNQMARISLSIVTSIQVEVAALLQLIDS